MTELEINKEIQAKVEFKMNEFLTGVKNRLAFKHRQAFDMTRESEGVWLAFQEVSDMINKEINMPTPYDNMSEQNKKEAKNKAVDKIMKTLDLRGREYDSKIRTVVAAIEMAQDW